MPASSSPALRRLVLSVCAVSLLAAAPLALGRSARRFYTAALFVGEDARGARARHLGTPTVAAIDAIRRAVPADGSYLLIDGGEDWQASAYWVRFELAPRRPILLGRWRQLRDRPIGEWLPARAPRWIVLVIPDGAPRLLDHVALVAALSRDHGSR